MPSVKNLFKAEMHGFASRSIIVLGAFSILVIVSIGIAAYFYMQYQKSQQLLQSPTRGSVQDAKMVIDQVGKLIELPTNEQPTIATVSDITKLKGQAFFIHAKNGDKVLIYPKAKKAILFDPITQKIVEVGPINFTQNTTTPSGTPAPMRLALYNGTTKVGLTSVIEKQLKESQPTMTVVVKENAKKAIYTTTTVVDLTGKNKTQAAALAQSLHGEVGQLPAGEVKPENVDLVVILGK